MSIASEITRLQQAKADIKTAIENKGVTVPSSATLDDYADLVDSISGGGGSVDWEEILYAVVTGSTGVDEFVFPSGVTKLKQNALSSTKFKSVTIPDAVRISTDREYSFLRSCTALTHVDFGSGLTRIDEQFCRDCTALTTVTIPSQITTISYMAFSGCTSLREMIVLATNPPGLDGTAIPTTVTDIYVPDASVSAYQSATNWTRYASKIKGISERPTT